MDLLNDESKSRWHRSLLSHIVDSFPLTNLDGSLSRLHTEDDDVVQWLENPEGEPTHNKKNVRVNASLSFFLHLYRISEVVVITLMDCDG